MAKSVTQQPAVDYFSLLTQKYRRSSPSESSSATYEPSLTPPGSCDEIFLLPVSSGLNRQSYNRPKTQDESGQVFNLYSIDDWMDWDEPDPADNALSRSPSISEEPLPQLPSALTSSIITHLHQSLYSTPSATFTTGPPTRLTPQEESRLRAIAMPSLSLSTSQSNALPQIYSPTSTSSPEPPPRFDKPGKRKSSVEDDDDEDMSDSEIRNGKPVKKTAHNMIEKRYRTNLNDKIIALRDSVPSLRAVGRGKNGQAKEEDLQGLTPAHKLNKATVLSKATEYIVHLEKHNNALQKEYAALKSRVEAFEILMRNQQMQSWERTDNSGQVRRQPYGLNRIVS